ncbi:MAG: hypothetical protein WBI17_01445 [Clostridiaceae bacterium]
MKNLAVKIMLGLIIFILIAFGIFYFSDNRYSLTYRSYNRMESAKSFEFEFTSGIGIGGLNMALNGNIKILPSTAQTLSYVALNTGFVPVDMDVYTEKNDIYYKVNFFGMGWAKGIPAVKGEEGYNPIAYGEALKGVNLLDAIKFISVFDRSEKDNLIILHTDDAFTLEEVKAFLKKAFQFSESTIDQWDLTGYDLSIAINKDTSLFDSVTLVLKQNILATESLLNVSVKLVGLNNFTSIEVPSDLTR